jgi:hypothetical protein
VLTQVILCFVLLLSLTTTTFAGKHKDTLKRDLQESRERGEELLVNYGEDYHNRLIKEGILLKSSEVDS